MSNRIKVNDKTDNPMRPILFFSFFLLLSSIVVQGLHAQQTLAEADFSMDGIKSLEVRGKFCNVEIRGKGGGALTFDGYIRGSGNPDRYAIVHRQQGDHLEVWVESPASVWGRIESLLKFDVPPQVDIRVENSSGNLELFDIETREIGLEASSGNVETGNTTGRLNIECSSGNVTVNRQMGELEVETTSGNIKARSVRGATEVEATSGNIDLDDVEGPTSAVCTSGNITMDGISGKIYAETSSGNIRGDDIRLAGQAEFRATSGNIRMDLLNREEELSFDLEAGSGNLKAGGSSGDDQLILKKGDILVRGSTGSGNQTYNTR
jgi:hypothetical protein